MMDRVTGLIQTTPSTAQTQGKAEGTQSLQGPGEVLPSPPPTAPS